MVWPTDGQSRTETRCQPDTCTLEGSTEAVSCALVLTPEEEQVGCAHTTHHKPLWPSLPILLSMFLVGFLWRRRRER